jgi:hypothetical protein
MLIAAPVKSNDENVTEKNRAVPKAIARRFL